MNRNKAIKLDIWWEKAYSSTGKRVIFIGDGLMQKYYRKFDENGNIKRTKVSRGSGEIHSHMWKEILKKQLQVTEEYFNKVI